jgi:PAS domain S-box-containing protein
VSPDRQASPAAASPGDSLADIFPGNSAMSALMRAHDWSTTRLGPPDSWPDGLKVPLRMMLTSRFEMWLGWGPDLAFFYNDAYRPTLGIKHPRSLGMPTSTLWAEIWDDIRERVETVLLRGEATWDKALLLLLERNGYPEETYHTFSYSPLRGDSGGVEGLMCIVTEETERVISERRLDTLRRLAVPLAGALTTASVLAAARACLATNRHDFPFSLIRLADSPDELPPWLAPSWTTALTGAGHDTVGFDIAPGPDLPTGQWNRPPQTALAVPIPRPGDAPAFGLLVVGLNPHLPEDPGLAGFAELVAGQIAAGLAGAEAFEAERRRAAIMTEAATLRREAAEALEAINQTLAREVESRTQERDRIWGLSQELMGVVRPDGTLAAINPAWQHLLGWPESRLIGADFTTFLHPDDIAPTRAELARLAGGESTLRFDNRFRAHDGAWRWIRWTATPADGVIYGVGRDVTEEREAADRLSAANSALIRQIDERERVEATLRQMQKMESVGQLTGGIAHDFNNMLAVIIGGLNIARRRLARGEGDIDRFVAAALEGAGRAASLTQRLLAFSRQQPLAPKVIEVNRMIAGMHDLLERTLGERIRVETVGAGRLWNAHADPGELENALVNLAVNARDAMPDGGRLTIETANAHLDESYATDHPGAVPGQYVMLAVTDTGTGMTAETRARAFDPFFTTKPVGKGTGLGLSQVYGFVRQSGGHIDVYSEPGIGTTVKLYLPRFSGAAPEERPIAAAIHESDRATGEKILVVEDEDRVRALSIETLKELGYRVLEADSAMAALRLLDAHPDIALMFTDVVMPEMNGRKLADEARRRRPDIKILYTTGYTRNAVVHNGVLDQGVDLVSKPFTIDALARKLRDVLDR